MTMTKRAPSRRKRSEAVYFLSLSVENVRCFGPKQTLDLSDGEGNPVQWTIILGNNGVGKTTLLEAIVYAQPLQVEIPRKRNVADYPGSHPTKGVAVLPRGLSPLYRPATRRLFRSGADGFEVGAKVVSVSGKPFRPVQKQPNTPVCFHWDSDDSFSSDIAHFMTNRRLLDLKCYAYGASRKMSSGASIGSNDDNPIARLLDEDSRLRNPEEWLLEADHIAAEVSLVGTTAKRRLEAIERTLIHLLPEVDEIHIQSPENLGDGYYPRVKFHTPYGWLFLEELAHGYRTMIAWSVDLASRMFDRYPYSTNPLAEPAVVLVDEIDLHLHPRWQREIISFLSERFPATQFIVTAHSPLIVQAASKANIAVLRREGDHVIIDQSIQGIRGWRIDQVLTSDLFGLETARPPEFDELMRRRKAILTRGKLSAKDKKKLAEVERKLGSLPTGETREDIEAMAIIRSAAARLKASAG